MEAVVVSLVTQRQAQSTNARLPWLYPDLNATYAFY